MKKLPVGLQNFANIIQDDWLYVDKTEAVHRVLTSGNLFFLSRPRRFGKSLLVSTFRHLFGGKRELFKDLYIGKHTDYDFEEYPVLQFNFASLGYKVNDLEELLIEQLQQHADGFGVVVNASNLSGIFKGLVEKIAEKGKPVVILIDEYDKPIVDFLKNTEKAKENQAVLRRFFSPLKDLEARGHLRFLFITGVSKFSKVSLFSDLNNLKDLSISEFSHDLLGITHSEMLDNFAPFIEVAAQKYKMSKTEILEGIKLWYNGYSYDGKTWLYNPFSILNFFGEYKFRNYWFATGTPTFLVETIRDQHIVPQELEDVKVSDTFFDKFSLEKIEMVGLLFQTGYLTIKEIKQRGFERSYILNYPNLEVRRAFVHNLLEAFSFQPASTVGGALINMQEGLETGKPQLFVEQLTILLSDISYHLLPPAKKTNGKLIKPFEVWEGYFHTIIYLATSFMGLYVQVEITKHQGRLDLIAETEDFLYLMEFKLDEPAKNAIAQIKARQYAAAYQNSTKSVYLVGIGFSKEMRNVETWEAEIWNN